jgi:hypothetical protein
MRSFIICTFALYYYGYKIKEDEMVEACSKNGRSEIFSSKTLNGRDHL